MIDSRRNVYLPQQRAYAGRMDHLQEAPAINWTNCLLTEINPEKVSGVPILKGTRMPADAIIENYTDGLPADEIAEIFQLPVEAVRGLLAYAVQHNPALKP